MSTEEKQPAKMGRKPKKAKDRIVRESVYLLPKEVALIVKKHGSLTAALKKLLLDGIAEAETSKIQQEIRKEPVSRISSDLVKEFEPSKSKPVSNFMKQRQKSKNKME